MRSAPLIAGGALLIVSVPSCVAVSAKPENRQDDQYNHDGTDDIDDVVHGVFPLCLQYRVLRNSDEFHVIIAPLSMRRRGNVLYRLFPCLIPCHSGLSPGRASVRYRTWRLAP